ncbi:kinase-like domain-containing protein, partial [Bombardia bombarda]
ESFREFRDNGLRLEGPPIGLESVYDYEPGGHHPVHLGDVLNGRYSVVDKLGSGYYANVWLCRDIQRETAQYFAVKILMADASIDDCHELRVYKLLKRGLAKAEAAEHLCLPLGRFDIQGPNGYHFALVCPVLGPRVSTVPRLLKLDDPARALRQVCFQVAKAIATLHSYGICHGDLRPANILARVKGLGGIAEEQISQALGPPKRTNVVRASGEGPLPPTAPRYLVTPLDWESSDSRAAGINFITNRACLIDFGESFDVGDLPENLDIPQEYRAPEYILDKRLGIESDIWSLGCTIFEIRTGRPLFDMADDDPDEHLVRMVDILGKFPEPWWSTRWEARRKNFRDNVNGSGKPSRLSTASDKSNKSDKLMAQSIEDAITQGLESEFDHVQNSEIEVIRLNEEVLLLADLLKRIFKYSPDKRISAEDMLEHAWFKIGDDYYQEQIPQYI